MTTTAAGGGGSVSLQIKLWFPCELYRAVEVLFVDVIVDVTAVLVENERTRFHCLRLRSPKIGSGYYRVEQLIA